MVTNIIFITQEDASKLHADILCWLEQWN